LLIFCRAFYAFILKTCQYGLAGGRLNLSLNLISRFSMTRKDLTLCLCYVLALFVPVTIARLVSPTGIDRSEDVHQTDLGQPREINPQDAKAYSGRGMVYQTLQNHPKALEEYNTAISKANNDIAATINIGLIYYEQDNKKSAIIQFQ
jgi:tetratricopeptide (TPR) repeat protein